MSNIGIFYGTNKGITENISWYIASQFMRKGINVDVYNVATTPISDLSAYDRVIMGASTWKGSVFHEDWERLFFKMNKIDFTKKKVAVFGTGNQKLFPMTFVDAMGYLFDKVSDLGANVVGRWSTDGYQFGCSNAVVDSKFAGLAIDEHNQPHKTFQRVDKWVNEISSELTH